MLLMISQFIAFFNFTNMPDVLGIALAEFLETAGIGALPLLIGMIVVILLLDIIMPGLVPKWAIFAPILVPALRPARRPARRRCSPATASATRR